MKNDKILEFRDNVFKEKEDFIAKERPLTIHLNNRELVTLLSTPQDLKELAVGFLASSLFIRDKKDIEKIILDEEKYICWVDTHDKEKINKFLFKRMLSSGCGNGVLFYSSADSMSKYKANSHLKIKAGDIVKMMSGFQRSSELFLKTGAVHSAALHDLKDIITVKEDIGRHNALDKIIGFAILNDISLEDKAVLLSGRVSSEIMFKAQKRKIPILVSQGAPTDQAVNIAKEANITLIGFARANKMNIYSGQERIIL